MAGGGQSVSNGDRVLQDEEFWGCVRNAIISSVQFLSSSIKYIRRNL